MSEPAANRRPRWVVVALTVLPLWLAVSAVVAVWFSIRSDERKALEDQKRFVAEMSVERIADDLRKFTGIIGERHTATPEAAANLKRAAAMIEGVLGPSNTGYTVERFAGPADSPILRAILPGQSKSTAPIRVIAGYDTPAGSNGSSLNGSGVAAVIAAAQAMAGDKLPAAIHFTFIPHAHHGDAPLAATLTTLGNLKPTAATTIIVDAMGNGDQLLAAASPPEHPAMGALSGLGVRVDIAPADTPLFSAARSAGLTTIRITTRLQPDPDASASTEQIAVAAGKLVEWLRRCARLPANG